MKGAFLPLTINVGDTLPNDHYTDVPLALDIAIISRGFLSPERYFKASSMLKRLRKTDLDGSTRALRKHCRVDYLAFVKVMLALSTNLWFYVKYLLLQ